MSIVINVTDIFMITIDNVVILTKNKTDILCNVSLQDNTSVELWECSTRGTNRNLIHSSLYTNFSTPSGASASEIVTAINSLLIA
jgi:hypothetical protein